MSQAKWVVRFQPRPAATMRLFCFPYAGSGTSVYRAWSPLLPPEVEVCAVQLPGRESRYAEPAYTSIPALVTAIAEGLGPELDRPFAFFGHSMGSLVAFELARALRDRGSSPELLFVSGRWAPDWPRNDAPIAHLSSEELLEEVQRRHQGIPKEILAHEELRALFGGILKSDMAALEGYRFTAAPQLSCPIVAFWGDRDRPSEESVLAWGNHSSARFSAREIPGEHFFLNTERELLLEHIAAELRAQLLRR